MEHIINTSQEIKDFYGNRLQKAFYNLVLCKNYNKENPLAVDSFTVIIHPNKLCGTFYDFTSADSRYEGLKWAAEANIQMNEILQNK